jgi:hypothetical protein
MVILKVGRMGGGVGPVASDQVAVPAQQRLGRDESTASVLGGKQSDQRREYGSVRPGRSADGRRGGAAPRPRDATPAARHSWPPSCASTGHATATAGRGSDRSSRKAGHAPIILADRHSGELAAQAYDRVLAPTGWVTRHHATRGERSQATPTATSRAVSAWCTTHCCSTARRSRGQSSFPSLPAFGTPRCVHAHTATAVVRLQRDGGVNRSPAHPVRR